MLVQLVDEIEYRGWGGKCLEKQRKVISSNCYIFNLTYNMAICYIVKCAATW